MSKMTELADTPAVHDIVVGDEADVDSPDPASPVADSDETHTESKASRGGRRRIHWPKIVAFGFLPALALMLAVGAAVVKWQYASAQEADRARVDTVAVARDSSIALLAYEPDKVEQQLGAAEQLLTGQFKDSYASLTKDVVIPGAKQKRITAVVTVPAAASVSASPEHAVALLMVDQTITVGDGAPTASSSAVRVSLDQVGGRWLISAFDPV